MWIQIPWWIGELRLEVVKHILVLNLSNKVMGIDSFDISWLPLVSGLVDLPTKMTKQWDMINPAQANVNGVLNPGNNLIKVHMS